MKKLLFAISVIAAFASCKKQVIEEAKETRPVYRPEIVKSPIDTIEGTKWMYSDDRHESWNFEITFEPDEVLSTTHDDDQTSENDSWSRRGESVFIYFNDKYATYKGQIISDSLITGKATNVNDTTWMWELKRIKE